MKPKPIRFQEELSGMQVFEKPYRFSRTFLQQKVAATSQELPRCGK
jgi:hypothetical protein